MRFLSKDIQLNYQKLLDIRIREDADSGRPTVVADPDGPVAANYRKIARQVAGRLAARKRNFSEVFPSILVQNT